MNSGALLAQFKFARACGNWGAGASLLEFFSSFPFFIPFCIFPSVRHYGVVNDKQLV
jgi:hypothetical protein